MSTFAHEAPGFLETEPALTHVPFYGGDLVITDDATHDLGPYDAQSIQYFIASYLPLKNKNRPTIDQATLLATGTDGSAYALDGTDVVVKVVSPEQTPVFYNPVEPITHMEQVRGMIDSLGYPDVKVPKSYGMFFPDRGDVDFMIAEQVHGINIHVLLNMEQAGIVMPANYREKFMEIILGFNLLEPRLTRDFNNAGFRFRDLMEDWGTHNVLVELAEPGSEQPPITYWIVDQLGYHTT